VAIPTWIVTVKLQRIEGIPAGAIGPGEQVFVRAEIDERELGRSRIIPSGATDFDLEAEPTRWQHSVPVSGSHDIPIRVELWRDRGDHQNEPLARIHDRLRAPFTTGFVRFGPGPTAVLKVQPLEVPALRSARVARTPADGPQARARVTAPAGGASAVLVVEITDVEGLYQPVRGTGFPRARRRAGYAGEGDRGRIFINRDRTGRYQRDQQSIQLAVRVHPQRGTIPGAAKIRWNILDADDPFDGRPDVHRQWAQYLDPDDYDRDATPTGFRLGGNEGRPSRSPPWEAPTHFTLSSPSATSVETNIVNGTSKVILHCPDVAGDNLIVRADVVSADDAQVFGAQTGVMTMWHRLDVEYLRMRGALSLPVRRIATVFEPACVELNFARPTDVEPIEFMALDHPSLRSATDDWVQRTAAHHGREGGWFLVASALMPYDVDSEGTGSVVHDGPARLERRGTDQYLVIPGTHASAGYITLRWPGHEAIFFPNGPVRPVGGETEICLEPQSVAQSFRAASGSRTGSVSDAYANLTEHLPQGRLEGGALVAPGFGAPSSVHAVVRAAGASATSGISPPHQPRGSTDEFFAGRTVVFTRHTRFYRNGRARPNANDDLVQVIGHELVHAFGMPHMCGYFDYRNPRQDTCVMNYFHLWMVHEGRPISGTADRIGARLCGRHIKEIRRTHLEDNPALQSFGW
jgi:hypothetical protein